MFAVIALIVIIILLVLMHTNLFSDTKKSTSKEHDIYTRRYVAQPQKPQREANTKFVTGQRVTHATFGRGTIIALENLLNDTKITVQFDSPAIGKKAMLAKYAELKIDFAENTTTIDHKEDLPVFNEDLQPSQQINNQQHHASKAIQANESFDNGEYAEYDVVRRLKGCGIPSETIFHNLYVEKVGGSYSQVDIVVPIDVGILVFEVKEYSGWIYGNANAKHWTQVLDYGKVKNKFFNPIVQNMAHISALRNQQEQLFRVPFFSIIVFHGSAEIKNEIDLPDNTFIVQPHEIPMILKYIRATHDPAPYTNKWAVMEVFKEAVDNGKNKDIVDKHKLRVSNYNN